MAATLTDELTRVSVADIEKWEEDGDTLYVYGKCTTPEVDTDEQVVDSHWSGSALKEYLATAPTVRVQHNPQRDPAGSAVRVDVNRDGDGAHWLKAAVDEPVAQRLVKKGHLRAFSVGIARPLVERDVTGKARGGIIRGGKVVEVSLVDSPANRSCFLELSKADKTGACEFTGKLSADDDFLAKALGADLLTKAAPADDDFVNVDLPRDASISISPADFARLNTFKQQLVTKAAAVPDAEKRDVSTAERRDLASDSNALPDGSYPIKNTGDLHNAAHLARTGHGDVAAARRLIARRARELGVANPLDESDDVSKGIGAGDLGEGVGGNAPLEAPEAVKEAEPDVTKDPEPEDKPKPVKKAKKKPKKLPPWLNKPKDDDGDSDDDSSCKEAHAHTEKCHTDPATAAGVSAAPMNPAPVGELLETPPVASTKGGPTPASASGAVAEHMNPVAPHREPDGAPMEAFEKDAKLTDGDDEKPTRLEAATMKQVPGDPEVAVLLRYKAIGVDEDLGRLHDLTCPAYHPEDVAKHHPYADLRSLIDSGAWQKKTLAAAAGPLESALKMQEVWQAALLLKTADMADLNDWRLELHKAFRDANPGPSSYPTPGMVMPGRYCRPVLTDGRADNAVDYAGPNTSPQVATGAPNAQHFDRPPLSSAQESPSPSFMKGGGGEYPSEQGVPVQLTYAQMQKEQARQALVRMHDHLSRQFPEACPMSLDAPAQPERHPVPQAAGIGKAIDPEPAPAQVPVAAAFKATPEDGDFFTDAEVYKGFKKMRKKLGKKVLSGSMTVDEARARLGRQFAQKGAGEEQEPVQKSATVTAPVIFTPQGPVFNETPAAPPVAAALDPEVIKAAVADATSDLKDLLVKQQETFTTKLAEQQRVIDAIADQPDPSTASFSGLAFNPVQKSARPAGVTDVAEAAERAQAMIRRNLQSTYYNHSSPAVREAAGQELSKLGWENPVT